MRRIRCGTNPGAVSKAITWVIVALGLGWLTWPIWGSLTAPDRETVAAETPALLFALAGLGVAAGAVNFVVLTAAASSANSGIYSTSRMLFGLSWAEHAPRVFRGLTARSVPGPALLMTCGALLTSIPLLYVSPSIMTAFVAVTTVASVLFILVWCVIIVSYLRFRSLRPELHEAGAFRLPGGRVAAWGTLAFFAFVTWTLTLADDTRLAVLLTPLWLVILGVAWWVHSRRGARS